MLGALDNWVSTSESAILPQEVCSQIGQRDMMGHEHNQPMTGGRGDVRLCTTTESVSSEQCHVSGHCRAQRGSTHTIMNAKQVRHSGTHL